MPNKIITLENLTEFKSKCDETYSGGGTKLYKHTLAFGSNYYGVLSRNNEPITKGFIGFSVLLGKDILCGCCVSSNLPNLNSCYVREISYSGQTGTTTFSIFTLNVTNGIFEAVDISSDLVDTIIEL